MDKSLIQGSREVPKALDPGTRAEGAGKALPKGERDIFSGVVVVNPDVTLRLHLHVEEAMRRDLLAVGSGPAVR